MIRYVRPRLSQITQPALVVCSTLDTAIHATSAQRTYAGLGSVDRELVTLHHSGHCITVDSEWEFVAEKTYDFIQSHV
jgi:carboxylesterase